MKAAAAAAAVSSVGFDQSDILGSMADKDSAEGTIDALVPTAQGDVDRPASREAGESKRGGLVKGVCRIEQRSQ